MATRPDILANFRNVCEERSGQWSASCPAHEDARNSLSIGEGRDGRILLKCHAGCATEAVLRGAGLSFSDLYSTSAASNGRNGHAQNGHVANGKPKPRGEIVKTYTYRDEAGQLLYEVCRMEPKDFRQRRPNGLGGYLWSTKGVRKVLYRLPQLLAADAAKVVYIVEGEKDVLRLKSLGKLATTNAGGAGKWRDEYSVTLAGRHVVIIPDNDQPGRDHARQVAASLKGQAASVKIVELPDLSDKGDVSDFLDNDGTVEQLEQLVAEAPEYEQGVDAKGAISGAAKRKPSQADIIVGLAVGTGAEFFRTPGGDPEAFATVPVEGHRETMRVRSAAFRSLLSRAMYAAVGKTPSTSAMQDALGVLTGMALFDGGEHPVAVRLAEHDGAIYLDLADEAWRSVKVTQKRWRIVEDCPVRFIRPRGVLPLPAPEEGGRLADLREFLNVANDDDFILLATCILSHLRPKGPYPLLALYGEQGSAKSTATRIIRELVDPNKAPLRSEPREPRDLMIAAANGWIIALENLSSIPVWLSDGLCRLATGGGFATRELYTDGDEKLFDAQRPVIINGVTEMVQRPDLVDRAVAITLPTIPGRKRLLESRFWPRFHAARPKILGALLDALSTARKNLPAVEDLVHEERRPLPRMADFAVFGMAAEPAMGVAEGTFVRAYSSNRKSLNATALESCPIVPYLHAMLKKKGTWTGTASELLELLNTLAPEDVKKPRDWPARPNALSGMLRRTAPNLRRDGIDVNLDRQDSKTRKTIITIIPKRKGNDRSDRSDRSNAGIPDDSDAGDRSRDRSDRSGDRSQEFAEPRRKR
jgi:5S rRNA maturation endonuclease (ribonuclease M5)